jgi:hypothetical protein
MGPGVTAAGGRIYVAFLDNPEMINVWVAAGSSNSVAYTKGMRTMKSFNAWERFTYNVPLTRRRKMFDVDTTSVTAVNDLERATQGAVITSAESVTALDVLGQWRMKTTVRLMGLNNFIPIA